jgi:D-alanyl-D-alanine carboxypeptidase
VSRVLRPVLRAVALAACGLAAWPAAAAAREYVYVDAGAPLLAAPAGAAASTTGVSDAMAGELLGTATVDGEGWTRLRWHGAAVWAPSDRVWDAAPPLPARTVARLRALAAGSSAGATGAMVADAATGQVLFAHRPDAPLVLASVTKLFTVAAAAEQGRVSGELARRILRPSDNLLADRLAARLGGGSVRRGALRIASQLGEAGVGVRLADGSGLSRRNRASAAGVLRLLEHLETDPGTAAVAAALPASGRSGTLRRRLRGTAAEGACRAKTGTLDDVSTLAGLCTTLAGRRVRFALLMNRCDVGRARRSQDRMLRALVAWDRPALRPVERSTGSHHIG